MTAESNLFTERARCISGLTAPLREALQRRASARQYSRGSIVVRQGSLDTRMVFVLKGRLKLTRLAEGGRLRTLRLLNEGECFCTAPLNGTIPSPVTVECQSDAEVATLRSDEVASLLAEVPGAAVAMVSCLSRRLGEAIREATDGPHLPVSRKVAMVLMDLYHADGKGIPGPVVLQGITHEEVASLAGTVREVASRTLSAFEKRGLLKTGRGRITILDSGGLEAEAQGLARETLG